MNAEIVAVGTELLLGFTVNTDTVFLGRVLASLGIDCYHQVTVGDNRRRLAETLEAALARSDGVITCGGLGPTVDDVTLETIAQVTGRPLVLHRPTLRRIKERFARLKIQMPRSNLRQAMVPKGAVVFPNEVGTAPGFLLRVPLRQAQGERTVQRATSVCGEPVEPRTKLLVALPGPPSELIPMVERRLISRLKRFTGKAVIRSRTLKVTGLTESEVDRKVADLLRLKGSVTVGIYAHPSQVDLRITAKAGAPAEADRLIAQVEVKLRRRLKELIFGADDETLESVVGPLLRRRKLTLSVAESCTGGLVQHRITEIPGSSDYLLGGIVAYANELKSGPLAVSSELLRKYGAVSSQVAKAMAIGVRRLTRSDLGVGITGIAGPTGGSSKKPVGLVYIALATQKGVKNHRYLFTGERSIVKWKASQAALDLLRRYLEFLSQMSSSRKRGSSSTRIPAFAGMTMGFMKPAPVRTKKGQTP